PAALAAKRHSIRLILPLYQQVRLKHPEIKNTGRRVKVAFNGKNVPIQIWSTELRSNLQVFFADAPEFFDRPGIYGSQVGVDFPDNDKRYALFSQAVFSISKEMGFQPDVLHAHDWQTGLTVAYLNLLYSKNSFFAKTASVFTIHNLAYQ